MELSGGSSYVSLEIIWRFREKLRIDGRSRGPKIRIIGAIRPLLSSFPFLLTLTSPDT